MTRIFFNSMSWLAAGLALAAWPVLASEPEGFVRLGSSSTAGSPSTGVVRISDAATPSTVIRGQSHHDNQHTLCMHGVSLGEQCRKCERSAPGHNFVYGYGYNAGGAPTGGPEYVLGMGMTNTGCWNLHPVITNCALGEWLKQVGAVYYTNAKAHAEHECQEKSAWLRCKFGYLVPTGNCGSGASLFGHYSMVYPVNPQHFDQRDGQVYSAQGYGGPVSVPLAPVVNHTYNYGWGIPSSRLTPVSHPTFPPRP